MSRDPRLKQVIAKVRRQARGKRSTELENLTDLYLLIVGIAARLSRKKRARALKKHLDIVSFLAQVSLLLKENIFDRPEVKQFFKRSYTHLYRVARKYIAIVLPEKTQLRPARRTRAPLRRARLPSPSS